MSQRTPIIIGTALVAGAGYYLYRSGGNAKAAEQQFQATSGRDSAAASGRQVQSDAERYGAQIGAKADEAWSKANKEYNRAAADARAAADSASQKTQVYVKDKETRFNKGVEDTQARMTQNVDDAQARLDKGRTEALQRINQGVDAFDKKVDDAAAKTKSNVSGWFGGK